MRLERYVTVKRNIKRVNHLDETGVTLKDVREIVELCEALKTLLYGIKNSSENPILNANIDAVLDKYLTKE